MSPLYPQICRRTIFPRVRQTNPEMPRSFQLRITWRAHDFVSRACPGQPPSHSGHFPTGQGTIQDDSRTWPLFSDRLMAAVPSRWNTPRRLARRSAFHAGKPARTWLVWGMSRRRRQKPRKTKARGRGLSGAPGAEITPRPRFMLWEPEPRAWRPFWPIVLFPQGPGQCPTKYCDEFETASLSGDIIKCTLPLKCGANRGF